jgi:hypothetical protein
MTYEASLQRAQGKCEIMKLVDALASAAAAAALVEV